ncbi:TldD/PmbA family protein [Actinomarinicola tropica]|uniref:TldD/PmbA family protein n=1 Tax=Actinomarinicola tropica TaxID=2789776 RepID=UPI001899CE9B|nr:TldD/PmbA family protein [Actinomarinicola tropica]
MSDPDDSLLRLARGLVERADAGEQLEVTIGESRRTTVRVHGGEVESFTSATSHGAGIRVIRDGREGFAHAGSLDPEVLDDTLAEARDNAAFATPDEHVGLVEPDGVVAIEVDHWRDESLAMAEPDKIARAVDLERRVRAGDPRVRSVRTAIWSDGASRVALASTAGLALATRGTSCSLSVSAIAGEGDDTATGAGVDAARAPGDLDDDAVVADAVHRATELLGGRPVASQRLTLVVEPRLAAMLLGIVAGTLTGDAVLKGRSPFADRRGDAIASPVLRLVDDPTDLRSLGADSHDGEGLATRRNVLVDDGVLRGFLYDGTTGRRAGTASTASAVRGSRSLPSPGVQVLVVEPGARSADELLADVELGFAVRSFNGLHSGVNPVSGDFSVGAEGRMIRGGALAEPVREVTVAGSLQRMLLDLREVGADIEWLPSGAGMASLVIDDVSLGGR